MRFPILYKHKKIFVWYSGHWINLSLEASAHGGGFKGYRRFFHNWIKCMLGKHTIGHYCGFVHDEHDDRIIGFERYTACMYCHGLKKIKDDREN